MSDECGHIVSRDAADEAAHGLEGLTARGDVRRVP